MKLVELLARELEKWPHDPAYGRILCMTQDADSEVLTWEYSDPSYASERGWVHSRDMAVEGLWMPELASDHTTAIVTREQWEAERAKQSAWTGQGLPKVGTVCRADTSDAHIPQLEVIGYYSERQVWVRAFDSDGEWFYSYFIDEVEFHPIKTPEQIAAEERKREVRDMAAIISKRVADFHAAEDLYDAGYRKQS